MRLLNYFLEQAASKVTSDVTATYLAISNLFVSPSLKQVKCICYNYSEKLTYCRDRSSSRYPCYSSRKPPGEGAMLSYNTICWTQSSKWNCFGIGISWRKVRWYTFELWRPHYHVLRDIETISFPSQTIPTETETNYDGSDTNSFSRQNFFFFSQNYCLTDF